MNQTDIMRAKELLNVAADYIETHWPEGTVEYDEAECDGYCLTEDCRDAAGELVPEDVSYFHDHRLPPLNWEGYYTRKGGTRWFWCVVVAHDQGKAVVRTKSNHYHAHSPDEFEFSKEPEGHRVN